MKSKDIQYWTLLIMSSVVSLLYLAEIFVSHAVLKEQRFLSDQRDIAQAAPYYKDAWQKLAVDVWKASAQDPTLLDLLKSEGIGIHQGLPPAATPQTNAAPATPAPAPAPTP